MAYLDSYGQWQFSPGEDIEQAMARNPTDASLQQAGINAMGGVGGGITGNSYFEQKAAFEREKQRLEMERAAALRAQGLNPDGSPMRPEWQSLLDENGNLKNQYQMNIEGLDPSKWEGYSQYKKEALRTGPSAWANMQLEQQGQQALLDKGAAAKQAMTAQNQAQSNLAMRGGLSGGARALLAGQGAMELLNARQRVQQGANQQRFQTLSQDEQNRIQQLGNLASSEQNIGQYNKTLEGKVKEGNLQNLLREVEGKRGFDMGTYQEQMKRWAANKQAEATSNSGGGGGK